MDDFGQATHTLVLSDLHLTEVEEQAPSRPLWKRHKHRDLSIDEGLAAFLAHYRVDLPAPAELVLNGDIFDFDSVMATPSTSAFPVRWIERKRGLGTEEPKSRFKMAVILRDHPIFLRGLRDWVLAGHRVVVVLGNHDLELSWPSVRKDLVAALDLPAEVASRVRFCEWFYVSNGDTLVEHGSQYDAYCVSPDPLHPTFRLGRRVMVRIPFGNIADRMMLNGMGLFNPHVESTFIKSFREYVVFFVRHVRSTQPLLGWTWLWGALATLVFTLRDGFMPVLQDPLRLESDERSAAERANSTPEAVRALRALQVHPAIYHPWMILRELWLDRALLLAFIVGVSFEVVAFLNVFSRVSIGWGLLIFVLLLPPFAFYARSVNSEVTNTQKAVRRKARVALEITGTQRLVFGHTHVEGHLLREGTEILNTGTWSQSFEDAACTRSNSRRCYAWIRPDPKGEPKRVAGLFEWKGPSGVPLTTKDEPELSRLESLARRLPMVRLRRRLGRKSAHRAG